MKKQMLKIRKNYQIIEKMRKYGEKYATIRLKKLFQHKSRSKQRKKKNYRGIIKNP